MNRAADALTRVFSTAKGAFADFLTRDAAIAVLVFVVLYKLCDALAGAMTAPFVLGGLGYDKATYAAIVKGVGLGGAAGRRICRRGGGACAAAFTRAVARRRAADDLQFRVRVALLPAGRRRGR